MGAGDDDRVRRKKDVDIDLWVVWRGVHRLWAGVVAAVAIGIRGRHGEHSVYAVELRGTERRHVKMR